MGLKKNLYGSENVTIIKELCDIQNLFLLWDLNMISHTFVMYKNIECSFVSGKNCENQTSILI